MKIVFNVPDGECCESCPQQEDFDIEEMEVTTLGDSCPHYIRAIVAKCRLFNQQIEGTALDKMNKCAGCRATAK